MPLLLLAASKECSCEAGWQVFLAGRSPLEASTAIAQQPECSICMEAHPASLMHVIGSCLHSFCIGCLTVYLRGKLDNGAFPMTCPRPQCKAVISLPECRLLLQEPHNTNKLSQVRPTGAGNARWHCPLIVHKQQQDEQLWSTGCQVTGYVIHCTVCQALETPIRYMQGA